MSSVLIAPIGDHPVIVTGAVDALSRAGIHIEKAHILCPDDSLIKQGAEWAGLELNCKAELHSLPFADANSETAAKQYLQNLACVLESCEGAGDEVHLLLAGGRKNMSALTGVIAQFFPCVKKLYHLLDVHEGDPLRQNLFTVKQLIDMSDNERQVKMHPSAKAINLFELPFPRFTNASEVRRFLYDPMEDPLPLLSIDTETEGFYGDIFQHRKIEENFELWLTETAFSQFEKLWDSNRNRAEKFRTCFGQMQQPGRLCSENGMHGKFGDKGATFHFYKRRRTPERPFYYTLPNPIHSYPSKEVRQVVVCGLSLEINGGYKPPADDLISSAERTPRYRISDLPSSRGSQEAALLIPMGETLMVATQAYTLLERQAKIKTVDLIYPEQHHGISNIAHDLAEHFRREGVAYRLQPISKLKDVASMRDCEIYLKAIAQAISGLRQQHPDVEIHLLLSGGRKSMATLNLFAAQRAGLTKVWHTLVKDPKFERCLEEELGSAPNASTRRNILFLRQYTPDNFDVFAVPVFPMI